MNNKLEKTQQELRELAKKVKIIFFDIDDTLRVKDKEFMPESIPSVFERLHKKGIRTGIASGRAYFGVVPEVRALGADYYVTINGQYVRTKEGEEIFSNPIPKETIQKIIEWANAVGMEYGMVGKNRAVVSQWTKLVDDAITVVYGKLAEEPDFWQENPVYQMWTFTDEHKDNVLPEELRSQVRLVRWHPHSCDIVPIHGSKANGIEKVLEKLGLTDKDLMVFGDELNDVEMFQYAGLSIAMGNANEELKPLADYVTKDIEENGVEYALEMLGLIDPVPVAK